MDLEKISAPTFEPKISQQELANYDSEAKRALARDWNLINQKLDWSIDHQVRSWNTLVEHEKDLQSWRMVTRLVVWFLGAATGLAALAQLLRTLKVV